MSFRGTLLILLCVYSSIVYCHTPRHSLTLSQAEVIAIHNAPDIQQVHSEAQALRDESVAAGQLKDPKILLSAKSVPTDSFSMTQIDMTELQVGLSQAFPRGHSLAYQSKEKSSLANAEEAKADLLKASIKQTVRNDWLTLYYWLQAQKIVDQEQKVFEHLVEITESMLSSNLSQQKDVIRAQLEVSKLKDRQYNISKNIQTARGNLARWIGPDNAARAAPKGLPHWPMPPNEKQLRQVMMTHPILQMDATTVNAQREGVNYAEEQYKPGFDVAVVYGYRQGDEMDGEPRSNLLTAALTMDLPIFTSNRQDKSLAASEQALNASQEAQSVNYLQFNQTLVTEYATWHQLSKSAALYKKKLIPQAHEYAEATLTAYQNTQTDFPTLARANVDDLDTKLLGVKTVVDREKARAALLYLQGK